MIKINNKNIAAIYFGSTSIASASIGDKQIFFKEPPVVMCTISASISPSGYGYVSGTGQYEEGSSVTITASPYSGFRFTGWQENNVVVSTSSSYSFVVNRDRTLIAMFAVQKPSRLPSGYTEVEYIQSDRACGIDTGFKINPSTAHILLDIEPIETAKLNSEYFCGTTTYTANSRTFYGASWRNSSNMYYVRFGVDGAKSTGVTLENERVDIHINLQSKKVYIGDKSATTHSTTVSGDHRNNLYLFSRSASATVGSVPAKLYSAKIQSYSTVKRDFVPCINPSNVVGLYDLIESKFYQNALSGTFTAGPPV